MDLLSRLWIIDRMITRIYEADYAIQIGTESIRSGHRNTQAPVRTQQPATQTWNVRRTDEFDPDEFFEPDCPLCQLQRSKGVVVFDDYGDDSTEEILLE